MKLVWTYNDKSKNLSDTERITLINYYITSIYQAKKLGYYTIIYCNNEICKFWEDYCDEVITINDSLYLNSPLWDSFKMFVIDNRDDEFCLIDGDVLLHTKLPIMSGDVVFDSYEILNWKKEYESTINKLTDLNIKEVIGFWSNERIPVMSCGILYFYSNEMGKLYCYWWKKFNEFILNNINSIDTHRATAVGAQYLLTIMCKKFNLKTQNLSKNFGEKGRYYHHYFGDKKYLKPLVDTNNIININSKSKLF